MFVDSLFSEGFQLVESKRTLKTGSWQSEPHLEKQGVGDQVPTGPMSGFCPGRLGALEVERRIGAEAGAWGERGWWRRPDVQSPVASSVGGAGCVLSRREGRVSCPIGGVGWWLKRVRGSEAVCQVANSHRFGWRGLSANEVRGSLRSRGGSWCWGVSVGVGFGCGVARFWGKLLCLGAIRGGVVVWASGPPLTPAST
jgi:hypothetical protein